MRAEERARIFCARRGGAALIQIMKFGRSGEKSLSSQNLGDAKRLSQRNDRTPSRKIAVTIDAYSSRVIGPPSRNHM